MNLCTVCTYTHMQVLAQVEQGAIIHAESLHVFVTFPGPFFLPVCVAGSFLSSGLSLNILSSKRLP